MFLASYFSVFLLSFHAVTSAPTAAASDDSSNIERREPQFAWIRPFRSSGVGSWLAAGVGAAAVGSTLMHAWEGIKEGWGKGASSSAGGSTSNSWSPQNNDQGDTIVIPYSYPAAAQPYQADSPPSPDNRPASPENPGDDRRTWNPQAQQGKQGQDGQRSQNAGNAKTSSLLVTMASEPVYCRKFPDTISTETVALTVLPGNGRVGVNCWTTASMSGDAGKVENDAVWLRTDAGCYINEAETIGSQDYQAKLNFCVAPLHWVGQVQQQYNKLDCYQCPTLKCPSRSLGEGVVVDVQCLVDGEEARGNNTWVKPVDQNCFLPAEIFNPQGWMGTFGGKC